MNRRRAGTRTRPRSLLRVLVRVPGCLLLASGLLLAASTTSSAAQPAQPAQPAPTPPSAPSAAGAGAVLDNRVTPLTAEVDEAENGEFTLSVTNTGTVTAGTVRVLLDEGSADNPVGSADGRCLSRLDAYSPADLWCELGALAPQQTVSVQVHAYMSRCVWLDPGSSSLRAPAFSWRVGYTDAGTPRSVAGPTPRWSCAL
jgi:hypothetical protein